MADHPPPLAHLLEPGDPEPVKGENCGSRSPFFLVCDHAGRATPGRLGRLGLPEAAFETHVAWDIGALDLARRLAEALDAPLIHQLYSRLVIDCNRDPAHPGSIVTLADGWRIEGNRNLSAGQAAARRSEIFDPYHARIDAELASSAARGARPILVCVHSFTPSLGGVARPWHVGVLHLGKSPASTAMLGLLRSQPNLSVGDNQPYAMDGTDFTAPHHAGRHGLDMLEIEVRQDLLSDTAGVSRLSGLLAPLLDRVPAGA